MLRRVIVAATLSLGLALAAFVVLVLRRALLAAGADPRAESPGGSVLRQGEFGGNQRIVEDLVRVAPGLHLGHSLGDQMARLFARLRSGSRFVARLDAARQGIR
jgi:hypothetical protein